MTDWGTLIDSAGGGTDDTPLGPAFVPGGYDKVLTQYGELKDPNRGAAASQPSQDWGSLLDAAGTVQASAASPEAPEPSWSETFATAKQNLPTPGEFLKRELSSVVDPNAYLQDIKNVRDVAVGTGEYLAGSPPSPEQEQAKALGRHYLNYFSSKGLKENIAQRPETTLTDVLSVGLPTKLPAFVAKPMARATEAGLTAAGMKATAGEVMEAGKSAGLHFTQPFTQELSTALDNTATKFGYRPRKHTRVKEVLDEASLMSEGLPSLDAVHNLRQDINDALASPIKSERRIGFELKRQLDTVFTNLEKGTPEQIQQVVHAPPGVDPVATLQNFKRGMTEYAAASKAADIEHILDKAEVSGFNWTQSGIANAIKTEFRKIYKNDKTLRKYTPVEQQMIKDIAAGRLSDHALTLVSKFAIRGPVSFAVGHLVGGGVVGHGLIAGTGELAQRAIARRQIAKVERLRNYILTQGDTGLRNLVGETVYKQVNETPSGSAAIKNWLRNPGRKTQRALAIIIAQSANRPDLIPVLSQKLSEQAQGAE